MNKILKITGYCALCLISIVFILKVVEYNPEQYIRAYKEDILRRIKENVPKDENKIIVKEETTKSDDKVVEMSRLLTKAMKKMGQLSCEISKNDVAQNGGWCSRISGINSPNHIFDSPLAKELSSFLAGTQLKCFII